MLKDDETKKIAQTAHKTIKTLQDLLAQKNDIINLANKYLDNIKIECKKDLSGKERMIFIFKNNE